MSLSRSRHPQTDLAELGLEQLLADGRLPRQRPAAPAPAPSGPRRRIGRVAPLLGWGGPYAGRAVTVARPAAFRAATGQVAGLFPFLHASSLPPIGAYIGTSVQTGRSFSAHPALWVIEQITSNPNILFTGIPGSGKSGNIKALVLRLAAFGVKSLIAGDVKGEYNALCRWMGVEPLELGPGLPGRLNPLSAGPLGNLGLVTGEKLQERLTEIHRRRMSLMTALLDLQMRRPMLPEESEAVSVAIKEVTGELRGTSHHAIPTLRAVHAVLRDPTHAMAYELRVRNEDVQVLREQTASVRAALGAMAGGHLGSLFDAETSSALDWSAPIQSIDISRTRQYGDETVAMIMTCVSSWAQAAVDEASGGQRMVVRDELWRLMGVGGATMVRKIDSDLRLSRGDGVIEVLATHRLNDFAAVGSADSEAVAVARGMISNCDTRITMAQDIAPLEEIREAVGLSQAEVALISSWGRTHAGRGLWRVGRSGSHAVQLHLTPRERELFHTDERMALG